MPEFTLRLATFTTALAFAVSCGTALAACLPRPPGGLHGAPMPPGTTACHGTADTTAARQPAANNAWGNTENTLQAPSTTPFPVTPQPKPAAHKNSK